MSWQDIPLEEDILWDAHKKGGCTDGVRSLAKAVDKGWTLGDYARAHPYYTMWGLNRGVWEDRVGQYYPAIALVAAECDPDTALQMIPGMLPKDVLSKQARRYPTTAIMYASYYLAKEDLEYVIDKEPDLAISAIPSNIPPDMYRKLVKHKKVDPYFLLFYASNYMPKDVLWRLAIKHPDTALRLAGHNIRGALRLYCLMRVSGQCRWPNLRYLAKRLKEKLRNQS